VSIAVPIGKYLNNYKYIYNFLTQFSPQTRETKREKGDISCSLSASIML